jgi:lysyl-tRNA synthetase class 2
VPRSPDPACRRWSGERTPLEEAVAAGGSSRVAGRFLQGVTRDLLQDGSGGVRLLRVEPRPRHGDLVAGRLLREVDGWALLDVEVLTPSRREPTADLRRLADLRPTLEARARILDAVRGFFRERGFLEVETPARVTNPGLEPHLRPFPAGDGQEGEPRWLITSPELHLKRLLAAGHERIFEIARAFRDDETGDRHAPEFALLEWYRAWATLDEIAADLEALVPACCAAAGVDPARAVADCDLSAPFERLTYREAFLRHAAGDPHRLPPDERERIFVTTVEPRLGFPRPLLLSELPADAAALARLVASSDAPADLPHLVAARLELYAAGVELGNGFDELTDAAEQRLRHEEDRRSRLAAGVEAPPLDEDFLEALEAGLPPSAGLALGLDRLVLVLLGRTRLSEVRAFP